LTVKVIVISYGVYSFGGAYLLKRMSQVLPNGEMRFFQGDMVSSLLRKCQNLSEKILTKPVMRTGNVALKILFYSTTVRYTLQRVVMMPLYPAQSRIIREFVARYYRNPFLKVQKLNNDRRQIVRSSRGFICRDVVLEKDGVRYSGMLMGYRDTIRNGNWALQATGNAEPIENTIQKAAQIYHRYQYNTLMINGPSVGKSQGTATPSTMGDAQDVGISFLETALKAKKIVIAGRSLGGAAIGQAILKHHFKEDVKYLVVRQMTFDCTSNICAKVMGQISPRLEWGVAKIIQSSGCEMDSVAASEKLQQLDIQEVIVQASHRVVPEKELPQLEDFKTDGPIIDTASLGYALIQKGITDKKVFRCLPDACHMTDDAISAPRKEIRSL